MCGISGILVKRNNIDEIERFEKATALMHHRGPDHFGKYIHNGVGLFHHRLSIIDLDARSNQPFFSASQKIKTIFNGEVYNYRDLATKHQLTLRTTSDTEVITELFEKYGTHAIQEFNGIFSAAFLDEHKHTLHLTRDRFGVKPLYLYEDDAVILFSSEAKVILEFLTAFSLDFQGLSEYLWFGNTTSGGTLIKGLRKVEPGTIVEIDLAAKKIRTEIKFWNLATVQPVAPAMGDAVATVRQKMEKAVQRQLMSDVPIGVFLSGGVDSSAITAMASKYSGGKLNTFSVAYDAGESELPQAAMVARKYRTNHHELKVEYKDMVRIFDDLVFQYDEPFADAASIPLYLLSRACKNDITVVLQGDGGDEFFAGYRRYNFLKYITWWKAGAALGNVLAPSAIIRQRLGRVAHALNQSQDHIRMALLLSQDTPLNDPYQMIHQRLQKVLESTQPFIAHQRMDEQVKHLDPVQKMLYADVGILLPNTYLEKVDKATMLCSIESRVPFLDNELADYALALPSRYKLKRGRKKFILKKAVEDLVPAEILNGKKKGFGIPYRTWLRTSLHDYAYETLEAARPLEVLNVDFLQRLLAEHKAQTKDHGMILWKSLVLTTWLNRYKHKFNLSVTSPQTGVIR